MFEVVTIDASGDANRTYCILDREGRRAFCVDPSFAARAVLDAANEGACALTDVFITHTHHDHVATLAQLKSRPGVRVWVHPKETSRIDGATPLPGEGPLAAVPGVDVIYAPGHTPGGVCYRMDDALFTGDTLFVDWVGRADFAGGDAGALFESLAKLRALPGNLIIHPGHHYGQVEKRTLAEEIQKNKFLACTEFEMFLKLLPELAE